ncbi:M24 family metallopeptidase [Nakamurella lactea]|uniref:M24 family metallopeptidase n=1 Tax=Nakamurella lactea TaxID=459515 RepID=UPI0004094276|nr:Xaa-Pro peptidase family protein [Nakamurella lactea]
MTTPRFSQRLPATFFDRVQAQLREGLAAIDCDALITDDPEDVAYLTGFFHHPCERPVAVWIGADGTTLLLLPELERDHALWQHARAEIVAYPEFPGVVPPFRHLRAAIPGAAAVAFTDTITQRRLTALQSAVPGVRWLATDLVQRQRYVKHPEEIGLHAEAARITDLMLAAGIELIRDAAAGGGPLPSEAELAAHVGAVGTGTMYDEHTEVVVVAPMAGGLVYAAENSVRPHGLPSGYRLRRGDTFMLSLGCAVGGRFVEGERTFILGEPTADQRRYYEAVLSAQQIGGAAIRPGALCREANAACLAVIREAGLGQHLRHRQGHGIGLGMHEPPWLEGGDRTPLAAGMIVSNEPGIYVAGHAGYRISDSMLVTEDGARPLTGYPRDLPSAVIQV